MNKINLYFKTGRYIYNSIGFLLFMIICGIVAIISERKKRMIIVVCVIIIILMGLPEWIRKRKYFGDIILKRVKTYRGKVLKNDLSAEMKIGFMRLTIVNEETGLGEELKYYNYSQHEGMVGDGLDRFDNIESIEFSYLEKSKIVIEVTDFKLKKSKNKKRITF